MKKIVFRSPQSIFTAVNTLGYMQVQWCNIVADRNSEDTLRRRPWRNLLDCARGVSLQLK